MSFVATIGMEDDTYVSYSVSNPKVAFKEAEPLVEPMNGVQANDWFFGPTTNLMNPDKVLKLVKDAKRYDERITVCPITYLEFCTFIEEYPAIKGVHYCNKFLVVTCTTGVHEVLTAVLTPLIWPLIERASKTITPSGGTSKAILILYIKIKYRDSSEEVDEVRYPDGSMKILGEPFPRILIETSYTNQSYIAFTTYLRSYLLYSDSKIKYVIGIFCRLKVKKRLRIDLIQVSYENNQYVENFFHLGNDSKGEEFCKTPCIMTLDKKHIFPEKKFSEKSRYIRINLEKFRSRIFPGIFDECEFQKNF